MWRGSWSDFLAAVITMMKLAEYVGGVGEDVREYGVLVEKPEGWRSLGRPRCR